MGLSPAQTSEHLPGITSFSELGSVLDRPLKTYSSGMYLRLAFSVATTINPDILVVDEHLSVGDQHFRKKCMDRINRLLGDGTALVFCSHDFYAVREVCSDCLWLRDGRPAMFGATADVLDAYQDYIRAREGTTADVPAEPAPADTQRAPRGDTCLREVTLAGDCRNGAIDTGGTLELAIRAYIDPDAFHGGVHVGTLISRNDRQWCYAVSTKIDGLGTGDLTPLGGHEYGIRLVFENLPLLAGQYGITVALLDDGSPHVYDSINSAAEFKVSHRTGELGMVRLPHRWEAY
jgi:lipopolysaccharide transport system ATP-binding protein